MTREILSISQTGKLSYKEDIAYFNKCHLGYDADISDSYLQELEKLENEQYFCFLYEPLKMPHVSKRESFYNLLSFWGIEPDDRFVYIFTSYRVEDFVWLIKRSFTNNTLVIYQCVLDKNNKMTFYYAVTEDISLIRLFEIDRAILYAG